MKNRLNSLWKIWIASSDLSGDFNLIKKYIENWEDSVVLKTAMRVIKKKDF